MSPMLPDGLGLRRRVEGSVHPSSIHDGLSCRLFYLWSRIWQVWKNARGGISLFFFTNHLMRFLLTFYTVLSDKYYIPVVWLVLPNDLAGHSWQLQSVSQFFLSTDKLEKALKKTSKKVVNSCSKFLIKLFRKFHPSISHFKYTFDCLWRRLAVLHTFLHFLSNEICHGTHTQHILYIDLSVG
jgi:hypothetical protein